MIKRKPLSQVRRDWFGSSMSAVSIGLLEIGMGWVEAVIEIDDRIDWVDFFDGCFTIEANDTRIVEVINREKYYALVHEQWVVDVLEEAIYNVTGIPFYVELQLPEGAA